jgi:serralysin
MTTVPTAVDPEVTFVSGIDANGKVGTTSFERWSNSFPFKWGSATIGSSGGTVTYRFDPASNWTDVEKQGWTSGFALWSAYATITFNAQPTESNLSIVRGTNKGASFTAAEGGTTTTVGSSNAATLPATGSILSIDTTVDSFGPIGNISAGGGYPTGTVVHEIGHAVGLGHGGLYNGTVNRATDQFSVYDTQLWTLMSYILPGETDAKFFADYPVVDTAWLANTPTAPMTLDIAAVQRLYGVQTSGPLSSGNAIYGFNTNIDSSIRTYFDFNVNTLPVISIWNRGTGNTLDLSGYSSNSVLNLNAGTFSSTAGLTNNIGIAYDTVIETGIGGSGQDRLIGSAVNNTLNGGAGNDTTNGGAGLDRLIGGSGGDRFVFDSAALSDAQASTPIFDAITDYNQGNGGSYSAAEGDQIDLSALLSAAYNQGSGQTVGALVRALKVGPNTRLQINPNAPGSNWTNIAQLDGILTGSAVNVILDASQSGGVSTSVRGNAPKDFRGSGNSGIALANGQSLAFWEMNGTSLVGGGNIGTLGAGWAAASGSGDFDGDGRGDVLLQNGQQLAEWQMNGPSQIGGGNIGTLGADWAVAGTGDFNGDGRSDLLLQSGQQLAEWQLNGTSVTGGGNIGALGSGWTSAGTGDFNSDGYADLLLQNGQQLAEWHMNGTSLIGGGNIGTLGSGWAVAGLGDFNGDGYSDLLLQNGQQVAEWQMNGTSVIGGGNIGTLGSGWAVAGIGDYNGDSFSDLLLRNGQQLAEWQLNGTSVIGGSGNIGNLGVGWNQI